MALCEYKLDNTRSNLKLLWLVLDTHTLMAIVEVLLQSWYEYYDGASSSRLNARRRAYCPG